MISLTLAPPTAVLMLNGLDHIDIVTWPRRLKSDYRYVRQGAEGCTCSPLQFSSFQTLIEENLPSLGTPQGAKTFERNGEIRKDRSLRASLVVVIALAVLENITRDAWRGGENPPVWRKRSSTELSSFAISARGRKGERKTTECQPWYRTRGGERLASSAHV